MGLTVSGHAWNAVRKKKCTYGFVVGTRLISLSPGRLFPSMRISLSGRCSAEGVKLIYLEQGGQINIGGGLRHTDALSSFGSFHDTVTID